MADTGDFDPIGRRPWPVLPEFRPSAQRVWEQQRSAPLPITTTQGEMRWGPALAPAPLVSRLGDSTGLNPGVNPGMEDLFAEIGERLGHGDFKGAALPIAGAVTGITQGKIRQGAKPKGQTKPDFAAGNFPPGFDTQKDKQGFYLKSKLVLDQMMKGNVNDNPVRVEYIRKQLKNHGITDAEINALKLPELLAKGPYIRRSEVLKHVNENRPEIQHAYYQGKEGQTGDLVQVGRGELNREDGTETRLYRDTRSNREYEIVYDKDAGNVSVQDLQAKGGEPNFVPIKTPMNRQGWQDAFSAIRDHVKQATGTVPPGAVGGTHYAGGNLVLDATAPHQEHAWGLGPNKEWAEAAAHHQQLYAEQAKLNDIIDASPAGENAYIDSGKGTPEALAAWKRLKENKAEIEASDRRLSEINAGRYKAGHITGGPNSNWDYLTHSRVAPVEFQAQGARVPGTLVEERQSDRYQQLRDRGARASPEAIAKAEEARNRAVKENQDAYEKARNWVANVNPDVDWRSAYAGRQEGTYGGGDATMVSSRSETQGDIKNALAHLQENAPGNPKTMQHASIVGQAKEYARRLRQLDEAESARHEELKAARSGVPGHPLINTAEAFNRFAAKTELLQAAKNAQAQGLPESASYWIGATPGPEQNARYGKSRQVRSLAWQGEPNGRGALYYQEPGSKEWSRWGQSDEMHHADKLADILGPDLAKRLLASEPYLAKRSGDYFPDTRFAHYLDKLPGPTIGGQPFDRTYGDNAFTPGTVNDTLHAQLRKLDPNTPEWTTANIVRGSSRPPDDTVPIPFPPDDGLRLVGQKRRPYGTDPREPNPPVEVRAHEMTPEARRKINEQGFSLFQLPIAAGIGASALAGSMLNQYSDPQEDQQ